ncbi:hypothetical protein HYPSUDRAFT_59868 [Hypholoma sublateritium FD-334 SS-4]|uniref:Uncharacterized protein n=1 Tax=Hypholoma sublateritium (strain FD-334 SS-4) TaxID=945553 RepID=A0A0D2NYG2_HYPSF|nr:hypothetical protein HYPSUDRAFT_59868 [Hypholoma sublateritium FD-334 SS-4]
MGRTNTAPVVVVPFLLVFVLLQHILETDDHPIGFATLEQRKLSMLNPAFIPLTHLARRITATDGMTHRLGRSVVGIHLRADKEMRELGSRCMISQCMISHTVQRRLSEPRGVHALFLGKDIHVPSRAVGYTIPSPQFSHSGWNTYPVAAQMLTRAHGAARRAQRPAHAGRRGRRTRPAVEAEQLLEEARIRHGERHHRVLRRRAARVVTLREEDRAEDAQDALRVVHAEQLVAVQRDEPREGNVRRGRGVAQDGTRDTRHDRYGPRIHTCIRSWANLLGLVSPRLLLVMSYMNGCLLKLGRTFNGQDEYLK